MPLIGPLLFLAACVGNTAIMAFSLNWLYGHALPRPALKALRQLHGLAVLTFPVGLGWLCGLRPESLFVGPTPGVGRALITGYVGVAWLVGLGIVPAVTALRLLRPRPSALAADKVWTVDIASELGYRPVGRGKYRQLARLPGNEVFQVGYAERTLCLPGLPAALDGLTVLHISDLHLSGTPDLPFFKVVMDHCRAWDPDLIALTGDVVDSPRHHRWIVPVLGRLRCRVAAFAVLGNHDGWYDAGLVRRRLRRLGFRVMGNRWEMCDVRGESIMVVGHEGPWFGPEPDLSGAPTCPFRLCLSHTPDNMAWARAHRMDLVLAGHNHGGQIRFPVIGSVLIPSRYSRRYDCGTFEQPPTVLHVSRGLAGQHPLRYRCRPEVAKLTLRPRALGHERRPVETGLKSDAAGR